MAQNPKKTITPALRKTAVSGSYIRSAYKTKIKMEVTRFIPTKDYPYLAVWVGKGESLDLKSIHNVKVEDIVLISMVEVENSDKQPYVQYVLGNKQGYITKHEEEYCPLPKGYSLTLCQ